MLRVHVGNIGQVYAGWLITEARKTFGEYVAMSKSGLGRCAGECVVLLDDDTIKLEYNPEPESE
jgi:hypothetical protein